MAKLPLLRAHDLIKILSKIGFVEVRRKGSHVFLSHPDGRTTLVPVHGNEPVDRGLLNKIIKKDLGMDRDEFLRYK